VANCNTALLPRKSPLTLSHRSFWIRQVNSLLPSGPAAQSGKISTGDQLISVDGIIVDTLSDSESASSSASVVRLCGQGGQLAP
jgi:hypothetical protein